MSENAPQPIDLRSNKFDFRDQPKFSNPWDVLRADRHAQLVLVHSELTQPEETDPVDAREVDNTLSGRNRAGLAIVDGLGRAAANGIEDVAYRFFHDGETQSKNPLDMHRTIPQNVGALTLEAA